jgi:hypothetical protein
MKAQFAALCTLLLLMQSCAQAGPRAAQTQMEIRPLREGESFRDAATQGYGPVIWTATLSGDEGMAPVQSTRDAVNRAAPSLAGVDYVRLSLPDFITPTRSLQLNEQQFLGGEIGVDAYAEADGGKRFALVLWQGPEIAQLPERPLVHRWVRVYALYDLDKGEVVRLVPTIGGEVIE